MQECERLEEVFKQVLEAHEQRTYLRYPVDIYKDVSVGYQSNQLFVTTSTFTTRIPPNKEYTISLKQLQVFIEVHSSYWWEYCTKFWAAASHHFVTGSQLIAYYVTVFMRPFSHLTSDIKEEREVASMLYNYKAQVIRRAKDDTTT